MALYRYSDKKVQGVCESKGPWADCCLCAVNQLSTHMVNRVVHMKLIALWSLLSCLAGINLLAFFVVYGKLHTLSNRRDKTFITWIKGYCSFSWDIEG